MPAAAVLGVVALRRLDQGRTVPVVEVALLRSLPHFADLPGPGLETLAGELECVRVLPGEVVIRQGDKGDRFYAIAQGEVAVSVDGHPVTTLGRGEGFGEVALLRSSPRNATITAIGPVTLFALGAESFLAVVGGHAATRHRAEDIAARRDNSEPKIQNQQPKIQTPSPKPTTSSPKPTTSSLKPDGSSAGVDHRRAVGKSVRPWHLQCLTGSWAHRDLGCPASLSGPLPSALATQGQSLAPLT